MADLIELDMVNFIVILCIGRVHSFYASIDCKTQQVNFQFPNDIVLKLKSSSAVPQGSFISYLNRRKLFSKGYVYHSV